MLFLICYFIGKHNTYMYDCLSLFIRTCTSLNKVLHIRVYVKQYTLDAASSVVSNTS